MVHGCMMYTECDKTAADGNSFVWHQPCQRRKYTTRWIFKNAHSKASHSCRITCKRSESARERRTALYKSDQQSTSTRNRYGSVNCCFWYEHHHHYYDPLYYYHYFYFLLIITSSRTNTSPNSEYQKQSANQHVQMRQTIYTSIYTSPGRPRCLSHRS